MKAAQDPKDPKGAKEISVSSRTRIAVLSDIHGNLPAFEAVLRDLDRDPPDEVLIGGDLVGRGPQGDEIIRQVRRRGWKTVRGNHEDYLLSFHHREVPESWWHLDEWAASRWMAAQLTNDDAAWVAALPLSLAASTDPALRLVHGTPASNNQGIGEWTPTAQFEAHFDAVAEPILVCAHTHRPLIRRVREGWVVNTGAVGLPFDGDQRSAYGWFERGPSGGWKIEIRRVEYDLGETLEAYEKSGFLSAGGVTAELLSLELREARPYLVPFLRWAAAHEKTPEASEIESFRRFYRPDEGLAAFFRRLPSSPKPKHPRRP